jgi:HlyD family secretion protein
MSKAVWVVGGLVLAGGVAGGVYLSKGKSNEPKFRREKLERGTVTATVTASGTLSAVITVKVGSQVSGIISKLYVDFNAEVKKGQLLAELDPTPFQASVDQRQADLEKSKVELRNAEINFARTKRLTEQQLLSKADFDSAQTLRDAAAASVEQSNAALKQAMTNLAYTKITSPIEGVVVDRQYDVGQTVAASFQAPVIFTIAQDLTKMQVLTNIDEADIGRIRVGQEASFSVDAFPDRPFRGGVAQIRLSPQTVQNVVTYPVLLDVPNPDLKLRPGMTANVLVPVDVRKDTLKVANAALRFKPDAADLVAEAKAAEKPAEKPTDKPAEAVAEKPAERPGGGGGERRPGGGMGGGVRGGAGGRGGPQRGAVLYLEVGGGKLKPVKVKTGITDGNVTTIESDELKEGTEIVVGLATARAGDMSGRPPGGGGTRGPRGF